MIAADTSVVVAAFAPWHEAHAAARQALGRRPCIPAHCVIEAYSTLTRMPDPFRAPPDVVANFLDRRFGGRVLVLMEAAASGLPSRLADLGIAGGSCYDALVAVTAEQHGAKLRTLDRRAERVYQLMGADYEMVAG